MIPARPLHAFGPATRQPPPGSPLRAWLFGVELGGRGHYAAAAAVLGRLLADPAVPPGVRAHAAVALASHRRQQGGHAAARVLDARALAWAAAAPPDPPGPDPDGTGVAAARVDALVGLAADAIGLGDADGAGRLLDAAEALGHPSWRPGVRAAWVRAELALLTGRAAEAVGPAERALVAARGAGSARHLLKSRLVRAVVRGVVRPDGAVLMELDAVADAASRVCRPLEWPARLAAADLAERVSRLSVTESSPAANDRGVDVQNSSVNGRPGDATRRRHAAGVALSALYQLSDGVGRRLMGESVWVPL